jgi:hypothetical protein
MAIPASASGKEAQRPRSRAWLADAAVALSLAALIALLAAMSWRKWPTVLLDFGHELYIPWRLAEGRVLYRDLALLYGPLSQYVNSLWFLTLGVSLRSLILANLAVLLGLTALVARLFSESIDRYTGWFCAVVLVGMFGFAHYTVSGNYNFICPYSHEATHGVLLATAMIWLFHRHWTREGPRALAGAGFCLGLTLLTRAEVALAGLAAAGVGLIISLVLSPRSDRGSRFGVFTAGAAIGPAIFFLYFLSLLPAGQAARAVAGAWTTLGNRDVTGLEFFRRSMGLDQPLANLWSMMKISGLIGVLAGAAWVLDRWVGKPEQKWLVKAAPGIGVFVLLLSFPEAVPWKELPRALPMLTLLIFAAFMLGFVRHRRDRRQASRLAALALWSALAFVLTGKMVLNSRLEHYGFYLAMPAFLTVTAVLVGEIPRHPVRPGGGLAFRCLMSGAILAYLVISLRVSFFWYGQKVYPVGSGPDRILTYGPEKSEVGPDVNQALEQIGKMMKSSDTFVALPETSMLNYLSRHGEPTPYHTFMLTELTAYGEDRIRDALERCPPDYVLLVERDTSEFGINYFGQSPRYGMSIMTWVDQNYKPVWLAGNMPLRNGRFGILILQRQTSAAEPNNRDHCP